MTLYEADVEMFSMLQDEMEEFKQASKNDADFKAYLTEVGAKEAVYLVSNVRKRRQELRRVVTHVYGQEAVDEINERVLDESEDLA